MLFGKTDKELDEMWLAWKQLSEVDRMMTAKGIADSMEAVETNFLREKSQDWKRVGIGMYTFIFLELAMCPVSRRAMRTYLEGAEVQQQIERWLDKFSFTGVLDQLLEAKPEVGRIQAFEALGDAFYLRDRKDKP